MKNEENFNYDELVEDYGERRAQFAVQAARAFALKYGPSYYTNYRDFMPHKWVVAALCEVQDE